MRTFELLCVNNTGACNLRTDASVCHSLLANTDLLGDGRLVQNDAVKANERNLTVTVSHVDAESEDEDVSYQSFLVRAKAPFDQIEPFRVELAKHLKEQKFDYLYVLQDDISSTIAHDLYPGLYRIENALRKYVLKFFVVKLGPNWWSVTADAEMQRKVVQRKNNETVFSAYADGKAYLIDFGELGRIVYAQSSGFISREDIFSRVMNLGNL